MWGTIGVAFERNCRDRNDRGLGELFFQLVVCGLAINQAEAPAVVMDYDIDVI